jgi:hypothetical protein
MSDQPVAKASTYTGQHHTNTKTNIHAPSVIRTRDPSNQAAKTYDSDRAATDIDILYTSLLQRSTG